MPSGEAGKVLVAQGINVDPAYVDPDFNVIKWGGTVLTGRNITDDLAKLQNLNVELTALSRFTRFGDDVEPEWFSGGKITAPPPNTVLVSKTVSSGKTGYIYGFHITAGEANDFDVNWVSGGVSKSVRIIFSGKGSLCYTGFTPFNKGEPADGGTDITITNVNAGSTDVVYQARLYYAEK